MFSFNAGLKRFKLCVSVEYLIPYLKHGKGELSEGKQAYQFGSLLKNVDSRRANNLRRVSLYSSRFTLSTGNTYKLVMRSAYCTDVTQASLFHNLLNTNPLICQELVVQYLNVGHGFFLMSPEGSGDSTYTRHTLSQRYLRCGLG